jgi:hypothetical protein
MENMFYGKSESGNVIHLLVGSKARKPLCGASLKKPRRWPSGDDLELVQATCPRCSGHPVISLLREREELLNKTTRH